MKAWMLLGMVLMMGCATTNAKPRWEIAITADVEYKPDHFTTTKAGVEFKRPLTIKK